jgi:hypothetical protein
MCFEERKEKEPAGGCVVFQNVISFNCLIGDLFYSQHSI